jgi:hypothetical protein
VRVQTVKLYFVGNQKANKNNLQQISGLMLLFSCEQARPEKEARRPPQAVQAMPRRQSGMQANKPKRAPVVGAHEKVQVHKGAGSTGEMSEQDQATFDGWAILEIFGHQRYAGRVKTEAYGQSVFWRIDVPPLEPRERISTCYECIGNTSCPPGTIVQEKAVQGYSKLFGSGAIYCLTPCTQEAAMKAVEDMQARPLMAVKLPGYSVS